MYEGHFPPLDHQEMVRPPPFSFQDRCGRSVQIHSYGDGPVADEFEAMVEMYMSFDPADRSLGVPPSAEDAIRRWLARILDGVCLVAWAGDRVIGHAVLVDNEAGSYELAIFVHRDFQGAGIGTALIECLLTAGREQGIHRVWLLVEQSNSRAVNLYTDVGFVIRDDTAPDVEMVVAM